MQILGDPGDPEVEVLKILAREEIVEGFPGEAVAEARAFGEVIDPKVAAAREDLRALPLATIDPKDARDHDDAVWVRPATTDDGEGAAWVAWIAIADVSSYVREGTRARRRRPSTGAARSTCPTARSPCSRASSPRTCVR